MGISETGKVFILIGKFSQIVQDVDNLSSDDLQCVPHDDDIGIVADIAGGSAQMDDALCIGALEAVSVDMAHYIMPDEFFSRFGFFVVDVIFMRNQLVDLLLGNRQAELMFSLGQCNPQKTPGLEFFILREKVLHFLGRITRAKGAFVSIPHKRFPFCRRRAVFIASLIHKKGGCFFIFYHIFLYIAIIYSRLQRGEAVNLHT